MPFRELVKSFESKPNTNIIKYANRVHFDVAISYRNETSSINTIMNMGIKIIGPTFSSAVYEYRDNVTEVYVDTIQPRRFLAELISQVQNIVS